MITLEQARASVGDGVVYNDGFDRTEQGTITSVNDRYVFVRYGLGGTSAATDPKDLVFLSSAVEEAVEQVPVVHLLNAYTWAGRRGACGVTAPALNSVHDRSKVTCSACLASPTTTEGAA